MRDIYPEANIAIEIKKLDKKTVATSCIAQIQAGQTKAQAIGIVLKGSDDVATFNEVWEALVAEGKAMRSVGVEDKTEAVYKLALVNSCAYLDSTKWYAGLLKEKDVKTYTELKTLYKGE